MACTAAVCASSSAASMLASQNILRVSSPAHSSVKSERFAPLPVGGLLSLKRSVHIRSLASSSTPIVRSLHCSSSSASSIAMKKCSAALSGTSSCLLSERRNLPKKEVQSSLSRSLYLTGKCLLPIRPDGRGGRVVCNAYEADASGVSDGTASNAAVEETISPREAASPLKLAIIFGLWYFFNVVFNIYNKKVLNVYPFPWLTSTFSLLAGTLFMTGLWVTKAQPVPKLSKEFLWALAPVALFHTIGHVAATVSMSKVAVSFTHIIKSSEPVFSVFVSSLFLGESFTLPVYLSLLPIVAGCSIAALTELTFNAVGFWGAMLSNICFVFRNVFSKKGLNNFKEIDGINLYAMICIVSLFYLTPLAFYVEGPAAWSAGWKTASAQIGSQLGWWIFYQSIFYHLYNQVSYMALDNISPLTFSVGNTMKRVVVIVASIIAFNTRVTPINAIGSGIAIFGTFLYSQAKAHADRKKAALKSE